MPPPAQPERTEPGPHLDPTESDGTRPDQTDADQGPSDRALAAAATHLSTAFDAPVRVETHTVLTARRAVVVRLQLTGAPVSTAILKLGARDGGSFYSGEAEEFSLLWNEWAGLQFLSGLAQPPRTVPTFYGADRDERFVLFEDFGDDPSLAAVLLGDDPDRAEQALLGYVDALLEIHLATFGSTEGFTELRRTLSPGGVPLARLGDAIWPGLVKTASELDVDLASGSVDTAMAWIDSVLGEAGWQAFSPNDCCPDNNQVAPDGRVRLFDFEFSSCRHALLDLAYVRTVMPSCWCVRRLPSGIGDRLVARYKDRLLAERPEISGTAFDAGLAAAQAYWALWALGWQLTRAVGPDGHEPHYLEEQDFFRPSMRQATLLRLDELADAAGRRSALVPLAGAAARLRGAARTAWGPVEPLPLYPAFKPAP